MVQSTTFAPTVAPPSLAHQIAGLGAEQQALSKRIAAVPGYLDDRDFNAQLNALEYQSIRIGEQLRCLRQG
jgi:hypothetical protein